MEIRILARNISLTPDQSELIERRVRFELSRFSSRVRTLHVTLSDVNGPKGGSDVLCRIKVLLKGKGEVLSGDVDVSVPAAIANVADRAARAIARHLERQHDHERTSMSGPISTH